MTLILLNHVSQTCFPKAPALNLAHSLCCGESLFSLPASTKYPGTERRTVEPKKGALSSCQRRLGGGDLGRQMVKSAQEGVGKLIPMEMGFPRHEDGDRAGLRLQGPHVHPSLAS